MEDSLTQQICHVCNEKYSRYKCPRCGAVYCSLGCYKQHDVKCTSLFYNESILESIKNEKSTKEEQISMAKKLKKFYNESNESIEINDEILNENIEKLKKLAIEDKITFNDLTELQKIEFKQSIRKGNLNKHIKLWEPWWIKTHNNNNNNNNSSNNNKKDQKTKPLIEII